ncbi:MAG: carbohydrate porin [Phycisphaerae bacterium]|nr:carbohydrate porin [Phycisphaerae bacterium]
MKRMNLASGLISVAIASGAWARQDAPEQPAQETPANTTPDATAPKLDSDATFKYAIPDISLPGGGQRGDVGLSPGDTPTAALDEMYDIDTPRRGIFHFPVIEAPIDNLAAALRRLDDKTGLRLNFAYTMLFQQTSNTPVGPNKGAAGDIDFMAAWTLLGRGTQNTGTLVFTTEYRFQIGEQPPSLLGGQLGVLTAPTAAFNDRGWVVRDAYWLQRLLDGKLRFILGRADISDFIGGMRMQAINTSFFNRAFSGNAAVAYPAGHGPAAGFSVVPNEFFYVTAGMQNAYSTSTTIGLNTLDDGDFFYAIEAGITPNIEGLGRGRYRVMYWYMDDRPSLALPSDQGISLIADQDIGDRVIVFARYGHSDGDLTNIKNMGQIGGGIRGLLGSEDDLTGLAGSLAEPERAGWRNEKVVEVFHRWQLTARTQFTVGAQLIVDPSNAPQDDTIGVFSFRFRFDF